MGVGSSTWIILHWSGNIHSLSLFCPLCNIAYHKREYSDGYSRYISMYACISFTGERLFRCDVCGKHFATNEYLKCHKRCHMGAKPYKCDVCGKTFGLRASLAQHSNVHAGREQMVYWRDANAKQVSGI